MTATKPSDGCAAPAPASCIAASAAACLRRSSPWEWRRRLLLLLLLPPPRSLALSDLPWFRPRVPGAWCWCLRRAEEEEEEVEEEEEEEEEAEACACSHCRDETSHLCTCPRFSEAMACFIWRRRAGFAAEGRCGLRLLACGCFLLELDFLARLPAGSGSG